MVPCSVYLKLLSFVGELPKHPTHSACMPSASITGSTLAQMWTGCGVSCSRPCAAWMHCAAPCMDDSAGRLLYAGFTHVTRAQGSEEYRPLACLDVFGRSGKVAHAWRRRGWPADSYVSWLLSGRAGRMMDAAADVSHMIPEHIELSGFPPKSLHPERTLSDARPTTSLARLAVSSFFTRQLE